MSDVSETPEVASSIAEGRGCVVVFGEKNQILLDYDDELDVCVGEWDKVKERIQGFFGIEKEEWWISKSGWPHQHACITLKVELPDEARVALAASLGSDSTRAMLAIARIVLHKAEKADRLFQPKDARISPTPFDYDPGTITVPPEEDDDPPF